MMAAIDKINGVSLRYLLKEIVDIADKNDCQVMGISSDSRSVGPGYLFAACNCKFNKSINYTSDAVRNGASIVLYESGNNLNIEKLNNLTIGVKDLHKKLGFICDRFYGRPSLDLTITGVTGTNGKTTVSHLIAQSLSGEKEQCGLIGTLGYGTLGNLHFSANTTPMPVNLHHYLADMHDAGIKKAVLEISSHGLDQNRITGTRITTGVFTNLSRDHLDYHADIESYANAKRKLFSEYSISNAVINVNDKLASTLINDMNKGIRIIQYGMDQFPVFLKNRHEYIHGQITEQDIESITLKLKTSWGNGLVRVMLTGGFNAYNVMACLAVLLLDALTFDEALEKLSQLQPVPGRMESFTYFNKAKIFVDYAHTPDALKNALESVKSGSIGRLICVFGCGGERDIGKRPLMGKVAEKYADRIILTSDNPRFEDPDEIIKQILIGIRNHGDTKIIPDRKEAISEAINQSKVNDVILIAGKGHEGYQEIKGKKNPFSDQSVVRQLLGTNND